jgi:hypothetical protein
LGSDKLFRKQRDFIIKVLGAATALAGVVGLIWGAMAFIDMRIERAVTSEEYIRKLGQSVRPTLIFNHEGAVTYDGGALALLDDITITSTTREGYMENNDTMPAQIIITAKRHLPVAPIITPVEVVYVSMGRKRVGKYGWQFDFLYNGGEMGLPEYHFLLELLP